MSLIVCVIITYKDENKRFFYFYSIFCENIGVVKMCYMMIVTPDLQIKKELAN